MMWSMVNSASLSLFHIGTLLLEDMATYMLIIVRELLSRN
jgi:hypothetical protein